MIRLLTSLVAAFTVVSMQSQTSQNDTPKLVVGITIDQLRSDYLEMFQGTFSEKGFKRLLNSGRVYQNISYGFPNINSSAAIATIYTGATPFYHGIISDKKFDRDKSVEIPIFSDDEFLGNYTKEKLSPRALKVSTITDELKIASKGGSNIYAFAPNISEALISGGHAANCVYWIDEYTGKWSTTTYYNDFHWTIDLENRNGTFSNSLNALVWKPLYALNQYKAFPYTSNVISFQHYFDTYSQVKKTPLVNENILNTSLKLADKAEIGKNSYPDFLALTFYLGNYPESLEKNYSIEIQDAYLRLDKELGTLLDQIDKTVGLHNTLIFVTSTGYNDAEEIYPDKVNMPNNTFYTNRCESLLNMYLMAIYGREQWVEKIYNNQIYLNRKLIEKKNLNLEDIQNKTAEFVVQFSGVQDATTAIQLITDKANANMIRYKNIFNKDISGDVFIEVQPGYKIVNEQEVQTSEKRVRETAVTAPIIFFGYNIKPERIKRTIKATEIAPTISHILRIRAPNACKEKVLSEFLW